MGLFSSILGGVSSLLGGGGSGKAIKQAAQIQANAAQAGIAENARQFDLTRADQQPWLSAGQTALGDILNLLGLNGAGPQSASIGGLKDSPLFQTLYDTGEETLLQNASATGGLRGGSIQRGLADFGSDTLTKVILQQLGQLGGISGTGLGAAQGLGALGQGYAGSNANLLGQAGAAQAGGILGNQAIKNTNTNNLFSSLGQIASDPSVDSFLKKTFGRIF